MPNQTFTRKNFRYVCGIAALSTAFILGPVNAQNPAPAITIAQAVRAYGLEKQSQYFHFASKQTSSERAIYRNVHFGSDISADTLTIEHEPNTTRIVIKFENANISTGTNILKFSHGEFISNSLPQEPQNARQGELFSHFIEHYSGDIRVQNIDVSTQSGGNPFQIANLSINSFSHNNSKIRFRDIDALDIKSESRMFGFKLAEFHAHDLNEGAFKLIEAKGKYKDIGSIGIGLFQIKGMALSMINPTARPSGANGSSFGGLTIDNIELRGLDGKNLGRFAIENIAANAIIKGDPFDFKLGELSIDNLNILALRAVLSDVLHNEEEPEIKAFLDSNMSDVYKGGPLSSVLTAFKLAGINVSGGGISAVLDDLSYGQEVNGSGIVTHAFMPQGHFKIEISDENGSLGALTKAKLAELGLNKLDFNWVFNANFDQQTDRVSINNTKFAIEDFVGAQMDGNLDGFWASFQKLKARKVFSLASETLKDSSRSRQANESPVAAANKSMDLMRRSLELYSEAKLVNANFALHDFGAISQLATMEAASTGKTPQQVRQAWRGAMTPYVANKTQPLIVRLLSQGLGNWFVQGGHLTLNLNPTQPVALNRALASNATANELGLKIEVKP